VLLLALAVALYFIPWIVAASRGHNNVGAIAVLNILLGWTVAGWIAAMVWSMTDNVKTKEFDEYADDGTDDRYSIWR
jgi:hypothetical protein